MTGFMLLTIAVTVAGVTYFARKILRDQAREKADLRRLAAMQAADAKDGINEDDPTLKDIVQAAREKGEL